MLALGLTVFAVLGLIRSAEAAGRLDADTLIRRDLGRFGGIDYVEFQAMFEGLTSNRHAYRTPCQIIAPASTAQGSGLLFFDWPNIGGFAVLQRDLIVYRLALTDEFLFGQGLVYATVRVNPTAVGSPWMDGSLDTAGESIRFHADEYEIVSDFVKSFESDPAAMALVGPIDRRGAGAYSAEGPRLRGLLRMPLGQGLFDFSLIGGAGAEIIFPKGNKLVSSVMTGPPPAGAGLDITFNPESEIFWRGGAFARFEAANMRTYEFAGCSHFPLGQEGLEVLPSPQTANPAVWAPLIRGLFAAADAWCDGIEPPPSIWLGAPEDSTMVRDAKGNALVQYVGGEPVETTGYRLPEVAVGKNQYLALDPAFDFSTEVRFIRSIAGTFVDLTHTFATHEEYVDGTELHALTLFLDGYLLEPDAAAIIRTAARSEIGK
jgi:hypothetical protein